MYTCTCMYVGVCKWYWIIEFTEWLNEWMNEWHKKYVIGFIKWT